MSSFSYLTDAKRAAKIKRNNRNVYEKYWIFILTLNTSKMKYERSTNPHLQVLRSRRSLVIASTFFFHFGINSENLTKGCLFPFHTHLIRFDLKHVMEHSKQWKSVWLTECLLNLANLSKQSVAPSSVTYVPVCELCFACFICKKDFTG